MDAAFLYLERKEIPLHIANVSVFDGPIPFKKFVARINAKLHLVPRYRQVVVMPPMNAGLPTWEDDPHFDIRRHIFHVTLEPPGGDAELEALAGRVLSQLLDRSKPLWDIHVVDGLEGGRGALIWRVHHALADGIAGTRLLQVMLDPTPRRSQVKDESPEHRPQPLPLGHSLVDGIGQTIQSTVESLLVLEKGLLGFAGSLFSDRVQTGLKGLVGLLPELAVSVERLPFNKPCSGDRKFCWAEFNLADVQALRETVGGTLNDVALTVVTRALAHYVKLHGQTVTNRFVRIVCPVSLRNGDHGESLGNQISFLPVALPMDIRNAAKMLRAVSERTATMKRAGAAHLVALAAGCIAAAPPPLQALLWWWIPQVILPVPLFNMICTDVPGPPAPLYAAGRKMLACYPQVPTGYDLGVGCAVQSYDGKLFFGLIADAHVASDVGRLRDYLYVSFQELCRAARLKGSKKSRPPAPSAGRTTKRARKLAEPVTATREPEVESPSVAAPVVDAGLVHEHPAQPEPTSAPAPVVINAKDAA